MDVSLSELRELVMDREAWRAVIHGVTKSWTQLSDWSDLIWLICISYLYMLEINLLPVILFANIFSHLVGYSFVLLMVSFAGEKFLV